MGRAIYDQWFVEFRFPGHENVKMVKSELGSIPKGWEVKRLQDVAVVNESSIRSDEGPSEIKYVNISSVVRGEIMEIETLQFAEAPGRARRRVQHGDIIWSSVRPNLKAYALILNPPPNLIVSTGFAVLSPKSVPYSYLYQATTTETFVAYLVNHTRGAAYPAVNTEDFEKSEILVPDPKTLDAYDALVSNVLLLRHALLDRNANLRRTRDLLLPKLISGEIDVSEMDIKTEVPA